LRDASQGARELPLALRHGGERRPLHGRRRRDALHGGRTPARDGGRPARGAERGVGLSGGPPLARTAPVSRPRPPRRVARERGRPPPQPSRPRRRTPPPPAPPAADPAADRARSRARRPARRRARAAPAG